MSSLGHQLSRAIDEYSVRTKEQLGAAFQRIRERLDDTFDRLATLRVAVAQLNPENVLKRGYALVRGEQKPGSEIEIEMHTRVITAEVRDVRAK